MTKPILAVDIDEVLAAQAPSFIAYTNKKWGLELTIDDYHEHWGEIWKTDHDETLQRAKDYNLSGVMESMSHFEEAAAVLRRLAQCYQLVIITARRKELATITKTWIERCYPEVFTEIYHAGIWDSDHPDAATFTKAEICLEVGARYLIDDQVKHCNAAQVAGVQSVLFGDYPWSRGAEVADGVIRCADWLAVEEYFHDRA